MAPEIRANDKIILEMVTNLTLDMKTMRDSQIRTETLLGGESENGLMYRVKCIETKLEQQPEKIEQKKDSDKKYRQTWLTVLISVFSSAIIAVFINFFKKGGTGP
jgi:hypothetical protein